MTFKAQCSNTKCGSVFSVPDDYEKPSARCPRCRETVFLEQFRGTVSFATDGVQETVGSVETEPKRKTIAGYTVDRLLGQGTFGSVYLAIDPDLNREIALKLPTAATLQSGQAKERFLREARAAAKLRHPNIVPVFKAGRLGKQYYIASAFIRGESLQSVIESEPLAFSRIARIVMKLADALDYAHRHGIVHRDVKPDNVMLDEDDDPQLTDFGIARLSDSERLTQDGSKMGTPAYMAPEQAAGRQDQVGPASDQYALGVILYEALTGKIPFEGSAATVMAKVISQEPTPVEKLNPTVPKDLATICQKALSKDPAHRYATCASMAEDLRRFLCDEPIVARPLTKLQHLVRWCKRNKPLATALALIFIMLLTFSIGGPVVAARQRKLAQDETAARKAEQEQRAIASQRQVEAEQLAEQLKTSLAETQQQLYYSKIYQTASDLAAGRYTQANLVIRSIPLEQRTWEADYLTRLAEGTPLTLHGHTEPVQCVACSADGRWIVSGGKDRVVKLWDSETGTNTLNLSGHTDELLSVAFSPDSQRIVSGSLDGSLKVWDVQTGREILSFPAHEGGVLALKVSPDGQHFASGGQDTHVKIWDAKTGKELHVLRGHARGVVSLAFRPDGQRVVSGSSDGFMKIWEVPTGTSVSSVYAHRNSVRGLMYSPDGQRIVSAGGDFTAAVWNAQTGKRFFTMQGHTRGLTSVAYSPDGLRIVTGCWDRTAKVWDAKTGSEIITLRGHAGCFRDVAFSADGQRIVSAGWDKTVKVWDANTGSQELTLRGHKGVVTCVAYSPDGRWLGSGSNDASVKLWDAQTGAIKSTLQGHRGVVSQVVFSPDGQRLASASWDKSVKLWNVQSGAEVVTLRPHDNKINCVTFHPNGRWIATASNDQTVKVFDVESRKEISVFKGHRGPVHTVAFSPDGRWIASGGNDNVVKVWDTQSGENTLTLRGHKEQVNCVAYSPTGRWIASGGNDNVVKVWDTQSGANTLTLITLSDRVTSVMFNPDGSRIISGSGTLGISGEIKVWTSDNGTNVLDLVSSTDKVTPYVNSIAVSPDGTRIVSGHGFGAGEIKIWDARITARTKSLSGHQDEIIAVAFTPDMHHIVSKDTSGKKRLWEIATGTRVDGKTIPEIRSESKMCRTTQVSVVADYSHLLFRKLLDTDLWLEDAARRKVMGPIYHQRDADAAERSQDWVAARFHLEQWLKYDPDNLEAKTRLRAVEENLKL